MSNSIWKKPEETPKDFCDVVLANFRTGSCCVFLSPFHNVSFDYDKWCYLTDLIAQADKAERLQKAVDLAVGALKKINETYEEEYYKGDDEHDSCDWLNCADDMDDLATDTIDEIKQLIKENQ